MNNLPILPRIILERQGSRADARNDHDVTTALTHDHWTTLSRFYAEHPAEFFAEADRSWGPRAERLRDKVASLS
jgi:Mlc titration factor MtfA (ptsG expression regulator)